jgi:GTP-binding protein
LENAFRRELDLTGTPIRIELRTGDNPYAGRKNKLSERQVQRRKRLVSHIKKADKKKKNKKTQ